MNSTNINSNSTITTPKLNVNGMIEARAILLAIALSDAIYLMYLYKTLRKWLITKDWKFLFPMVAALFAFSNNINDLYTFLIYPSRENNNEEYCQMYLNVFKITALFNWTPISWIQTLRLINFAKYFYTKTWYRLTFVITIALSLVYSLFYYMNLYYFNVAEHPLFGCSVNHLGPNGNVRGDYVNYIMIFDVLDSSFALGTLVFSAYSALDNLRELKFRHVKLKRMTDEGMIQLIILTISKIIFYPMIYMNIDNALGDISWDFLSVVVIICSYRMVNIRHLRNEKIMNNMRRRIL